MMTARAGLGSEAQRSPACPLQVLGGLCHTGTPVLGLAVHLPAPLHSASGCTHSASLKSVACYTHGRQIYCLSWCADNGQIRDQCNMLPCNGASHHMMTCSPLQCTWMNQAYMCVIASLGHAHKQLQVIEHAYQPECACNIKGKHSSCLHPPQFVLRDTVGGHSCGPCGRSHCRTSRSGCSPS